MVPGRSPGLGGGVSVGSGYRLCPDFNTIMGTSGVGQVLLYQELLLIMPKELINMKFYTDNKTIS